MIRPCIEATQEALKLVEVLIALAGPDVVEPHPTPNLVLWPTKGMN